MRRKIYSLRPNNDTCDWVANINIFLREFSIWPLSLGKLVDPEEYWKSFKSMINSINEVNKYISPEDHFEKPDNSVVSRIISLFIQSGVFSFRIQLFSHFSGYSFELRHTREIVQAVIAVEFEYKTILGYDTISYAGDDEQCCRFHSSHF